MERHGEQGERTPSQKHGQHGNRGLVLGLIRGAALRAVTTDLKPGDHDMEAAISLDLPLQSIKEITFEFRNLAAAQTRHVDVVPLRAAFVEMLLALHMHEVEFVNQSVTLEQSEGAVNRDPVNLRVQPASAPQQLAGIKVLFRGFHHAENGAALAGHAQPT